MEWYGEFIVDQIITEVKSGGHCSVLADVVADVSNKEQMPIILRFVYTKGRIWAEFIKFLCLQEGAVAELLPTR